MLPAVAIPCFLCSREPSHHPLAICDPADGYYAETALCDPCHRAIGRCDQTAGRLFRALQEGLAKGYTDAGFLHALWRDARAIGWDLFGAFMPDGSVRPCLARACAHRGLPHWVWALSRLPARGGLEAEVARRYPGVQVPASAAIVDGRYVVAPYPEGIELDPEPRGEVAAALVEAVRRQEGAPDPFTRLANREAPSGFEMIRRALL